MQHGGWNSHNTTEHGTRRVELPLWNGTWNTVGGTLIVKRNMSKNKTQVGGEDGGRVTRGDHLPSHRYSRNTCTRGTAPTEHTLNAGRKRQTSQKARNSPCTWVGQKKKEITETKE